MRSWPERRAREQRRGAKARRLTQSQPAVTARQREREKETLRRGRAPSRKGSVPSAPFLRASVSAPRRPAASCNLGRDVFPSAVAPWPARRRVPGEGSLRQRGPRRLPGTAIGQTRPHWYCHRKAILKTMNNLCILMNR